MAATEDEDRRRPGKEKQEDEDEDEERRRLGKDVASTSGRDEKKKKKKKKKKGRLLTGSDSIFDSEGYKLLIGDLSESQRMLEQMTALVQGICKSLPGNLQGRYVAGYTVEARRRGEVKKKDVGSTSAGRKKCVGGGKSDPFCMKDLLQSLPENDVPGKVDAGTRKTEPQVSASSSDGDAGNPSGAPTSSSENVAGNPSGSQAPCISDSDALPPTSSGDSNAPPPASSGDSNANETKKAA